MAAHLEECTPCRAEAEALGEVDRRLQRLGAYRGLGAAELLMRLDHHLDGLSEKPAPPQRRWPVLRLVALVLLIVTLIVLRWAR